MGELIHTLAQDFKYFNKSESPAGFGFFIAGCKDEELCNPVVTTTWEVGMEITAGATDAGGGGSVTAVFFIVFLGNSELRGTLLSSYSFLLTVVLIWALQIK